MAKQQNKNLPPGEYTYPYREGVTYKKKEDGTWQIKLSPKSKYINLSKGDVKARVKALEKDAIPVDYVNYQKDWMSSYIQSDKFKERLSKEMPKATDAELDNEIKKRLTNLQNTSIEYVDKIGKEHGYTSGIYYPKEHKEGKEIYIKSKRKFQSPEEIKKDSHSHEEESGKILLESEFSPNQWMPYPGYETIPLHEMWHSVDDGGFRIPDKTETEVKNRTQYHSKYGDPAYRNQQQEEFDYYTTPTEFIGRMQPMRYLLWDNNIYDANSEDFTEEHYQNMLNNDDIMNNTHVEDIMNTVGGETEEEKKKNLIWLMNNIANNDSENTDQQIAAYGGTIKNMKKRKKYGNGTKVTNYIENPYEELAQDKIDKTQAKFESESNPITNIMSLLGNTAMQMGMQQGGTGSKMLDAGMMMFNNLSFANGGLVDGDPPEDTLGGGQQYDIPEGYAAAYKQATGQDLPEDAYLNAEMYNTFMDSGVAHGFESPTKKQPSTLAFNPIAVQTGKKTQMMYVPNTDEFAGYSADVAMPKALWEQSDYYKKNRWQPTGTDESGVTQYRLGEFPFDKEPTLGTDPSQMEYDAGGGDMWQNQWFIDYAKENQLEFANGGVTPTVPVEIEGDEVIETPDGTMAKAKGPSHDNGGIPANLPGNTKVYSARIKIDGNTMAERKEQRERNQQRVERLLTGDESDVLLKGSLNRIVNTNAELDEKDMNIQEMVDVIMGGMPVPQMAYGGKVMKYANGGGVPNYNEWSKMMSIMAPNIPISQEMYEQLYDYNVNSGDGSFGDQGGIMFERTAENSILNEPDFLQGDEGNAFEFPDVTAGDLTSMAGTLMSSFGPYLNTLRSRAADTPNINAYEGFGEDALNTIDSMKDYVGQVRENQRRNLQLSTNAALNRGRNTARGVNTMRAMDLATQQQANQSQRAIDDSFANQMMNILGQEAQLENIQDQTVMQGEQARDLFDRQDLDQYYTNMAQNIVGMGEGIQNIGTDLNQIKQRDVIQNLLNQLSSYGLEIDDDGNIIQGE